MSLLVLYTNNFFKKKNLTDCLFLFLFSFPLKDSAAHTKPITNNKTKHDLRKQKLNKGLKKNAVRNNNISSGRLFVYGSQTYKKKSTAH